MKWVVGKELDYCIFAQLFHWGIEHHTCIHMLSLNLKYTWQMITSALKILF